MCLVPGVSHSCDSDDPTLSVDLLAQPDRPGVFTRQASKGVGNTGRFSDIFC